MREAYTCLAESNDTANHAHRRVRRQTHYQLTDEVVAGPCPVEPAKPIVILQQIVEEPRCFLQVLPATLGDNQVLNLHQAQLVRLRQRITIRILLIPERPGLLKREPDLSRPEVRENRVRRVEP